MLLLLIIGTLSAILNFAFKLLPGSDFAAIPDVTYSAIRTIASWFSWSLGLAGTEIKAAMLSGFFVMFTVNITLMLWDIVRNWRVPIIGRFFHKD